MIIWALILVPTLGGLLAFGLRGDGLRRGLFVAAAAAHLLLVAAAWRMPLPIRTAGGWLAVDALSILFLSITSILFLAVALYGLDYLRSEPKQPIQDYLEGFRFVNRSEAIFIGCLLLFLAAMTLVTVAQHLGILWVAVEATTLVSAPLIYYHRHHRSLEATWKYLLICSVGIALALLGNFFLAAAASVRPIHEVSLTVSALRQHAASLDPTWLKAAFLLMLVGYGTKMGLAPMHTWLPDAHSEAPSLVSALLSGALLNCAFVAILRMLSVLGAAGLAGFGRNVLVVFGLLSMGWAAMLLISQKDYKRMLAYSSVEHMGVLSLGIGIGSVAGIGALLHALNHSLTKAALFLVAGNILAFYRSKDIRDVRAILKTRPRTAVLWTAGILAIIGLPPFGIFTSELMVLKGTLDAGRWGVAAGYLAALAVAFAAIAYIALQMIYGPADGVRSENAPVPDPVRSRGESLWSLVAPAGLTCGVLLLGLWVPHSLQRLLAAVMAGLTGGH